MPLSCKSAVEDTRKYARAAEGTRCRDVTFVCRFQEGSCPEIKGKYLARIVTLGHKNSLSTSEVLTPNRFARAHARDK